MESLEIYFKNLVEKAVDQKIEILRSEESQKRFWYSLKELPFSKATAYSLEKEGKLKISRINGRSLILAEDLERCLRDG